MPEALLKMLLVAIFYKCKLYLQVLGHVLYAAVMLSKFYNRKFLYRFSASNTA